MNDPKEGTIFLDVLHNLGLDNIYTDFYNAYLNVNLNTNPKGYFYTNTYIGSFTTEKDELSLWLSYGSNCKGCALVFKNNFFDYSEENIINIYDDANQSIEKYCLYKVKYLDNNSNTVEDTEIKKLVEEDIVLVIKKISNQMRNEDENLKNQIRKLVIILLDQVRFLFKDKHYCYEKEIRLVKFVDESKIKLDTTSDIYPRLYIDIENEIEFSEIILGSKAEHVKHLIPYLIYTKKCDAVKSSSIEYE